VDVGGSNQKGNLAELKIAAAAAELGIAVLAPMTEHGRYDLIFDLDSRLLRVQCKWARRRGDVVAIQVRGNYHSPSRGYVRSTYSAHDIDAVAAYCRDTETCYMLPIGEVEGMGHLHLRLTPAKNGQLAGVRMASDYELGAVAQLEVAPRWQRGGRGFESRQLHSPPESDAQVGAHEFRNLFGRFMERETIHVTRRGKPYVTLGPGGRDPVVPRLSEA
jgi:PD-(D/E)XK endonuclease